MAAEVGENRGYRQTVGWMGKEDGLQEDEER